MEETENSLNPRTLNLDGDCDEIIEHILENIRLTRNEVEDLCHLFSDLNDILSSYWPGCEVFPFGSIVTGLGIKSSDVDCFILIPRHIKRGSDKKCVQICRSILQRHSAFQKVFSIANAKVPIVKFYHVPTERHCDVNFTSFGGVRNSKLVAYLIQSNEIVMKLTILIKYWAKVHKLTGTNLMSNYALTMLVIFYLQHLQILAPIYLAQEYVPPLFVDGWNTAFSETFCPIMRLNESMHRLIGGFFEFYADFDYKSNVISPYLGKCLERKQFEDVSRLPPHFSLYKQLILRSDDCKPLKTDTPIVVQDPFEHNRNCCVAIHPKLAEKILAYFQFGAKMYREKSSSEYLSSILLNAPAIEHIDNKYKKTRLKNKIQKQQKPFSSLKRLGNNIKKTFNVHYGNIYLN